MPIEGNSLLVEVVSPQERELEEKTRSLLLGKQIVGVQMSNGQLLIKLDDGGNFTISCNSGFSETSIN